jgi:hypothetical protein
MRNQSETLQYESDDLDTNCEQFPEFVLVSSTFITRNPIDDMCANLASEVIMPKVGYPTLLSPEFSMRVNWNINQ